MDARAFDWHHANDMEPRSYICRYCGKDVGPSRGYFPTVNTGERIYICSYCRRPTYFDEKKAQFPGVPIGNVVAGLPPEVAALYDEARKSASEGAFTAAVLTCRKILMHIAVQKGAKEGESFLGYVEFLSLNNYVPPDGKGWVDHIRNKGNEANHEIKIMGKEDGEELIGFTEMLLKFVFEFPHRMAAKKANEAK